MNEFKRIAEELTALANKHELHAELNDAIYMLRYAAGIADSILKEAFDDSEDGEETP